MVNIDKTRMRISFVLAFAATTIGIYATDDYTVNDLLIAFISWAFAGLFLEIAFRICIVKCEREIELYKAQKEQEFELFKERALRQFEIYENGKTDEISGLARRTEQMADEFCVLTQEIGEDTNVVDKFSGVIIKNKTYH